MGILDEAIREHLELKRQHGADDSELKQLEDEAFGPPERPEAAELAPEASPEAPTQFMTQPGAPPEAAEAASTEREEEPRAEDAAEPLQEPAIRREPSTQIASLQEPPDREREQESDEEGAPEEHTEEQPAMEHEAVSEPQPPAGPTTEEREAIAEHPTEHYDVETELAEEEHAPPPEEPAEEEEDEFFDEQRLSDELDHALESPEAPEETHHAEPEHEESEEHEPEAQHGEDRHAEAHEEGEYEDEEYDEEAPGGSEDDLLDETPDFLEDSEDDQLWFEQKPPKDFDFDD